MAQNILKIAIESKVNILSSSLEKEKNHLRFCIKRKIKNIHGAKFSFNAVGVNLYLNESLILHITEDYGENVKGSG